MEGVLASPLTDGYRNKCEFSIGCSVEGERVVGFQVGSFRYGHFFCLVFLTCELIEYPLWLFSLVIALFCFVLVCFALF